MCRGTPSNCAANFFFITFTYACVKVGKYSQTLRSTGTGSGSGTEVMENRDEITMSVKKLKHQWFLICFCSADPYRLPLVDLRLPVKEVKG